MYKLCMGCLLIVWVDLVDQSREGVGVVEDRPLAAQLRLDNSDNHNNHNHNHNHNHNNNNDNNNNNNK